jgi:hypothetical protein
MARAEKTGRKLGDAMERLFSQPTITVDDWAALNDVSRNTAYAEAAADKIEGAYKIGSLYRIKSATWRDKLGLKAPTASVEPEHMAA